MIQVWHRQSVKVMEVTVQTIKASDHKNEDGKYKSCLYRSGKSINETTSQKPLQKYTTLNQVALSPIGEQYFWNQAHLMQ